MFDRKGKRSGWLRARVAENAYNTQLRDLARTIGRIIKGFRPDGTPKTTEPVIRALTEYSRMIGPWAESVATYMLADVNRRNEKAWREHGKSMSRELRHELNQTPVGFEFKNLLRENVVLIQSLPLQAAQRVHLQVQEGMLASTRSTEIAKNIMQTGLVTESRAKLIARTEVSRAAVTLTQARAMAIGSQGYIWRTVRDGDVRPTHRAQEGRYIRWDSPPKTDKSLPPYHAGCGPNCRCFPEPVLPEF